MLRAARAADDPDGPGRPRARRRGTMPRASWRRRSAPGWLTDLKIGAAFPTDHPLHVGAPGVFPVPDAVAKCDRRGGRCAEPRLGRPRRHADARRSTASASPSAKDHPGLAGPRDCITAGARTTRACRRWICSSRPTRTLLAAALLERRCRSRRRPRARMPAAYVTEPDAGCAPLAVPHLAAALRQAVGERPVLAAAPAAVLGRCVLAVPPSVGLPRLRRRRWHRWRPRHFGRRGAGAARHRAAAGVDLRGRRLR